MEGAWKGFGEVPALIFMAVSRHPDDLGCIGVIVFLIDWKGLVVF